jgi:hypothetical protein
MVVTQQDNPTDIEVYDFGLYLLNKVLEQSGSSLRNFAMPLPQHDWDAHIEIQNSYIAEQLSYDVQEEHQQALQHIPLLNTEQREAFARIWESVEHEKGTTFFLNGPGGTGKTFVYKTICHKIRAERLIVLCVASSGIAALLLRGGRTAHSMFKIPVDGLNDDSICNIPKEGPLAELIRRTHLIIWDESGMQHRNAPEAVDRTCRDLRNNNKPFGGITVVFGGDFQQILPVIPRGSCEDIIGATIQRSHLWKDVQILHLTQNMRLNNDPDSQVFAQWLLDVGHGRNSDADSMVTIPDTMITHDLSTLIEAIYNGLSDNSNGPPPPDYFAHRTILAPRNGDVDIINKEVLGRMAGAERTYFSADNVIHEDGADGDAQDGFPVEFLRSLNSAGLPPGELALKAGCPLILLRNLAPSQELCNGTRMVLLRMSDRVLETRILGGDHNGETAFIPRISLIPSAKTTDFTFVLKRRQFPVRLAFAVTINKAQGQSVKFVGLDLQVPAFSHGQLYVALSRSTSSRHIKMLLPHDVSKTTNVIYPEVLLW